MTTAFRSVVCGASTFTCASILWLTILIFDCQLFPFYLCYSLALVPGFIYLPTFQIYRFLTFMFVNDNLILYVFDVIAFIVFDRLVAGRWGIIERLRFLLVSTWIGGGLCLCYYYIKFANTRSENDLYNSVINGCTGFCAGVTVLAKQLLPDLTSPNFFGRFLTCSYGPLLFETVVLVLCLLGINEGIVFANSLIGLIASWAYLRFFQLHTDGRRGDHRTTFSFVTMFPDFIQPILSLPLNFIYLIVTSFGICPKLNQQYEIISTATFASNVPNIFPKDSDRHKRLALQDLNARLSSHQEPAGEWPSLYEDEPGLQADTGHANLNTEKPQNTTITMPTNVPIA